MGRRNNRTNDGYHALPPVAEIIPPQRLEIWLAKLWLDTRRSVQGKTRPVIIISNDTSNRRSATVTVVPLTSKQKRLDLPTHVEVHWEDTQSVALAEQIQTVDKSQLKVKLGRIENGAEVAAVERAVQEFLVLGEC